MTACCSHVQRSMTRNDGNVVKAGFNNFALTGVVTPFIVGRVARIVTLPMRSKLYKSELLSQAETESKRVDMERKPR